MTSTAKPPAIDPEEFRRLGHELVDLVTDYLADMRTRPVFRPMRPAAYLASGSPSIHCVRPRTSASARYGTSFGLVSAGERSANAGVPRRAPSAV